MQYGDIAGVTRPLSRLIQGTLMFSSCAEDEAFALLDAVYAAGARAFDTAPVYGAGRAEATLGRWIVSRAVRDQVVIIDKGAHPDATGHRVTPQAIVDDVRRSLSRLGVEHIDLYLLHRDDPSVAVAELIDCLNEQRRLGYLHAFGASNWTHRRIDEANRYAHATGQVGFAASGPELNLLEPVRTWPGCLSIGGESGAEARAWYREARMPLLGWSPMAGGFLGGRFTRDTCQAPSSPYEARVVGFYASDANLARLDRLTALARDTGLELGQAALGYVASQGLDLFATVGCESVDEFRQCLRGLEVRFSAPELSWLERGRPKAEAE
jgi:aryl-alcohol dehydrogenase-like predicted oxidoreductase